MLPTLSLWCDLVRRPDPLAWKSASAAVAHSHSPAYGTCHAGSVGPASLATAMLKLLRLTCSRMARVENSRNPACRGAMLISPVFFIVHLSDRPQAVEEIRHISIGTCRRVRASF